MQLVIEYLKYLLLLVFLAAPVAIGAILCNILSLNVEQSNLVGWIACSVTAANLMFVLYQLIKGQNDQ